MTRREVELAVIGAITQIQEMSGRVSLDIGPNTIPIGDVLDFDSLNAFEATVFVAQRLNMLIPNDERIFVNEAGDTALSVSEIAGRVMQIADRSEGATDGK